jgi:hypothetical protein
MVKMKKKEIAPGIVVYDNVILDSKNLYSDIEEGMISAGLDWNMASVKESSEPKVNTKTRDTSIFAVQYKGKIENSILESVKQTFLINLNNLFFKSFDPVEKDYLSSYGISTDWHDSYSVLKYGVGQQFTNHIDDHPEYHRRVSTVYYLNNNYIGGEINFPRFDITFKPKENQMIIFPSTYVYNHSVSPVTEGIRYSVVSWLR